MRLLHDRRTPGAAVVVVAGLVVAAIALFSGSSPSDPAVPECTGASATDYACLQQRYRQLTKDQGIQPAFRALKQEYEEKPYVKAVCHVLTHEIGRTAAERYGAVAETYARGDTFCGSGYYHGAMETIVADIGPRRALEDSATLCADVGEQQRTLYRRNCVHGLGHGFMVVQKNDVFESLPACDRLDEKWEERNCYDGVFMQNIMSRNNRHYPSKHLKADEPMYPCTTVKARYKERCYERQTVQALLVEKGDFDRVFDLCARVEPDFRGACHRGLGRDAAGHALDNNDAAPAQAAQTVVLCHLGGDAKAREDCIVGAAAFLIRQSETDAQARELCRAVKGRQRTLCASTVERYGDGA
jgi:hypothetical protein